MPSKSLYINKLSQNKISNNDISHLIFFKHGYQKPNKQNVINTKSNKHRYITILLLVLIPAGYILCNQLKRPAYSNSDIIHQQQKENVLQASDIKIDSSINDKNQKESDLSMPAVIETYAKKHKGTMSVSFQLLDNGNSSVDYNANKVFIAASTYKLFVAYSTLRKIDSGQWKWSDKNISGRRNLSTCFDDMIIKSDNPCAEALLFKLGAKNITAYIRAEGLSNSGWINGLPRTTSKDLKIFLAKLYNNQLSISTVSRDYLIDKMKHNIYKNGIPSGTINTVADKVGFLDGLLHDAAIIYTPTSTYVLVIMTDGSSWDNISELTKLIELSYEKKLASKRIASK